ncbi:MAG: PQQ-binding-like beta-propeller repeat protein [Acidimicrobiia bacterium]|nr:PQQ-binding-like beta-propeller repeat protein [Acidimicrobiia bacterium]
MGRKSLIIVFATLLLLVGVSAVDAAVQPNITSINGDAFPRSGRIVIEGTGFGTGGEVTVGGLSAWTTTWTDTRVVAYVPEAAATGATALSMIAQGEQSNSVPLTVIERQTDGRVKWTFEADGDNLWWRPALAPDGTIYVHTNNSSGGLVYALSPDGGLLWTQRVNSWPYVPPSAGPDGAVYVGSIRTIYRISPQGNIDWEFTDFGSPAVKVAPTIGPDGLLYGVFEIGIGVFAMNPLTGEIVWSNVADPIISDKSGGGTEMRFGPAGPGQPVDQLYFDIDGGASFYAFSLAGEQLFNANFNGVGRAAVEPAIGSDGTIYGPRALGFVIAAADPSDGSTLWEYYPSWASGTTSLEIGPGDRLYFVGGAGSLEAFDTERQSRIWQISPNHWVGRPTISPDGATLVAHGSVNGFEPAFVKGYNPKNGKVLWTVELNWAPYPGPSTIGVHHPRITPDSTTAYVSTITLSADRTDPHTSLYAIDITSGGTGGGGKGKGGGKPK